jgi:hypothetical protein
MIGISVKMDVRACTASLNDIVRKQLPYAISTALNATARSLQMEERANLRTVLAHPRPFTANSVFYEKASKARLIAVVYIKAITGKYLMPFEFGGVHVLPGPAALVPEHVNLDQYGQLRKNTVKRLAARKRVFIGTVHGINGVWLRPTNEARRKAAAAKQPQPPLILLISFGVALPVKKHLNFHKIAITSVGANFRKEFAKVLATATKAARKTP